MKIEFKRALLNPYFVYICLIGILIAIIHSYNNIVLYKSVESNFYNMVTNGHNPYYPLFSIFTMWIGQDGENKIANLFYTILPIFSVIPYTWSYCKDTETGYYGKTVKKFGRFNYHLSKYIAVFISSGLVTVVTPIIDFFISIHFIPATHPDSVYDIYYEIFSNNFLADIFYTHPVIYVIIFILLNFVYYGLFGCIGYAVSTLLKSKTIALVTPLIIILIIECISNRINKGTVENCINISPYSFLNPAKSFYTNWYIIIFEIFFLFITSFVISVYRFKTNTELVEENI